MQNNKWKGDDYSLLPMTGGFTGEIANNEE